jgi:hypothetical protein
LWPDPTKKPTMDKCGQIHRKPTIDIGGQIPKRSFKAVHFCEYIIFGNAFNFV